METAMIGQMTSREEWEQIPGFKRYEINRNGIVRNRRLDRKPVPWSYCTNGYPQVSITANTGTHTTKSVHGLVVLTFIRPLLPGEETNHKDKKRTNPRLDNLEILPLAEHRRKHRKLRYGNCPICGEAMKTGRLYCSPECKHKDRWVARECKVCGSVFEARKTTIEQRLADPRYKNFAIYCSDECRLNSSVFIERNEEYLVRVRSLSPLQAGQVRNLLPEISNNAELGRMFGVSRNTIRNIRLGKAYRSLATPALVAVNQ